MRKFVLISFLFFVCHANATTPVMAAVISFDCPNCKIVFAQRHYLEQACRSSPRAPRCSVRFLPFVADQNDLRAAVYYEIDSRNKKLAEKFASLVYALNVESSATAEDFRMILPGYMPELDWDVIVDGAISNADYRIGKVGTLIVDMGIKDYPSFVWFDEANVRLIPAPVEPSKRVEKVVGWIESNGNSLK